MWYSIFFAISGGTLGGFPREGYLVYALWATFFSRISINWMYEFRMIDDIDTGKVNGVLLKPISFYEFYLGQFFGYKFLVLFLSITIPFIVSLIVRFPVHYERLPLAMLLALYNVIFVHTLSFLFASFAFFLNRVHSFSVAKNISMGLLAGDFFPLDLLPTTLKEIAIQLPFASGVYIPVAFISGRAQMDTVLGGFLSVTVGLAVVGSLAILSWNMGRRKYAGTAA